MKGRLQHVMKLSWKSEQMPGWADSLSVILEATKKEFQLKSKQTEEKTFEQEAPVLEEFSM